MTVTFNSYYGSDYLQPWNRVTSLGSGEPNNASDNYLSPISLSLSSVNQANYFDDGYLSLLIWSDEFTFTDPFQFYGADSAKEPFLTIDYEIVTVPVPAALYLLLSGIGALGLIARRKYTS